MNYWMLIGLAGMAIPIIIHLLNRRRFEVVDWGAMQFLQISETTRRRLLIEEVLLMSLRMALIGLMVLALASPFLVSSRLSKMMYGTGGRARRDVVIVFDGSYSMGFQGGDKSPHERAKEWALAYVNELGAGDSVAILQAKQQVIKVLDEPTVDLEKVRGAIRKLPEPRGGCQWPTTIQAALDILRKRNRPLREIIVLGDGQRFGWCDPNTVTRWELMSQNLRDDPSGRPNIWVVNVAPELDQKEWPNWTLTPIRSTRAVASVGEEVSFRTGIQFSGQKTYLPPHRIRVEVDGHEERDKLKFPATAHLEGGQLPLNFSLRFTTPGSHLVTVIVEPDPPRDQRGEGYIVKDDLPGDNRQDYSVEVVLSLPVLLVDGDPRLAPKSRGTKFLEAALAPTADRTPAILARVESIQLFSPVHLRAEIDKNIPGSRPRVLVLSNVTRLTPEQQQAVTAFLNDGGSVFVTLGERVDPAYFNDQLFRGGEGWLPARLEDKAGKETEEDKASHILLTSLYHPALEPFRETKDLANARFPRWWKVSLPAKNSAAAPIALFSNEDPFLLERSYGLGKVMMAAVPMDESWRTNFCRLDSGVFVPLAREIVYYLAGARGTDFNLVPGQPIRYRPGRDETPAPVMIEPPEGKPVTIAAENWPPVFEETRETGVYKLKTADDRRIYYVVQPDLQESDLARSDKTERELVAGKLGDKVNLKYEDDRETIVGDEGATPKLELWWLFMIGVTLLLCGEVWMTRKIALSR